MTTRPMQHEIDEAFAEIASKIAINDARKAAGAKSPSLPLSESATKTLFALYPELAPKEH
jgi:hypothetical protein